ncbi:hypothetical protein [Natronomonas sp. EA1]|uniref:hypothetical protein n=1 Tax=Natronomonas sp. EA1 TaxID=3421655 RepID=UPI003EBD0B3D
MIRAAVDRLLPPERRADLWNTARARLTDGAAILAVTVVAGVSILVAVALLLGILLNTASAPGVILGWIAMFTLALAIPIGAFRAGSAVFSRLER